MHDIGTFGGEAYEISKAYGINDSGQVVGTCSGSDGYNHAFLYSDGAMIDLNTFLPADSGWLLARACAINDSGQIVGIGMNPEGFTGAYLLTPAPEPGMLCLLLPGGLAILRRKKR